MISVNIHKAKTNLSALIAKLEKRGEVIQICRNGEPVAELRPIQLDKNPLLMNPRLKVKIHEDPALPLDEEDWPDDDNP